jgi:hypothetical protein
VPDQAIAKFHSLKLLDALVRLAQLANTTGLSISKDGVVLWERLAKEGVTPEQPVARLFALHDLRILKAHKSSNRDKLVQAELERFGIAPGETAAGYGRVVDCICDGLIAELHYAADEL